MSEAGEKEAGRAETSPRAGPGQALYLFGVARARSWRGGRAQRVEGDVVGVRYRDLEALVRAVPYDVPPLEPTAVLAHQRVVEGALRRGTVLPFPFGLVFRGRRQVIRLLEEQYLVLDEALSFLDGHWELRLHVAPSAPSEDVDTLGDLAMECYSELRRYARAAVPLPREEPRVLTAAFLVERTSWVEFVERTEDLGLAHPEISVDVTGPWPPYDFVQVSL